MRKSKKVSFMAIVLIVLSIGTVLLTGCGKNDADNNLNQDNLNIWNGTYINGKISFKLYRSASDQIELSITKDNSDDSGNFSFEISAYSIKLDSAEKLVYEDDFFGNAVSITISKTDEGVALQASSSDSESFLNEADGNYVKENSSTAGWDGVYKNGDVLVILAEVAHNELYMTISSGFSEYSTYFSEYTSAKISYENESFGDIDYISIVKTATGIDIQSSSTNTDSLLNTTSGSFTKIG